MIDELYARVHRLHPGIRATMQAPLGIRTTYRVGGAAALEIEIADRDGLAALVPHLAGMDSPVIVAGKGSNLLVADAGFDGLVLRLTGDFATAELDGTNVVAGGNAALPIVSRKTAKAGLTGFEWAVGVPGTIGGAVRMNAGGHGSDMASVLVAAEVLDIDEGTVVWKQKHELDLAYRHSNLRAHEVVLAATLELAHGDPEEAAAEIEEVVRWRRANQPGGQNAGSVFKNPPDDFAGRLIDVAGLSGHRFGTAHVSTKHANFIQVDPGGRADDVHELMRHVRAEVESRFGVRLEIETRLVGYESDESQPFALPSDPLVRHDGEEKVSDDRA